MRDITDGGLWEDNFMDELVSFHHLCHAPKSTIECGILSLFSDRDEMTLEKIVTKQNKNTIVGEVLPMRNSTAEFLTFAREHGAETIAVRFQDGMLWLTLSGIAALFEVDKSVASRHLSNIFASQELSMSATVAKYATVRQEGTRQVERQLDYYNLEAIIAVGYRVNSARATMPAGDELLNEATSPLAGR